MSVKKAPKSVQLASWTNKSKFDFTRKSSNDSINRQKANSKLQRWNCWYTPINKLDFLCDNKDTNISHNTTHNKASEKLRHFNKLKVISEAANKSKSSSISSNNRRSKKSAARFERSKQILSKSCERKQSKKKHKKVIQIVQNQWI